MSEHRRVHLGDLVAAPSTWNPARLDGDTTFTYIDLTAVDQKSKVVANPREVLVREAPSRARQVVADRDVLVSTVRPNLNAVALVPTSLDSAIASTGFCVLRPNPTRLDSSYLFHWVKTPEFVSHMVRRATGASYPAVSDRTVLSSEIPLPPLPEQQRIAAILDQADALRAKRQVMLADLETLTQSVFVDIFGNPATNPQNLSVEPFGAHVRSIRYGTGSPPTYVAEGIPFIRATNVKAGTISSKDLKFISRIDAEKISKCQVGLGDLIVVRSGVNTGDCALIPAVYDGAFAAFDLIVELEHDDAVYYNFLINSPFGKQQILPLSRRAAQPHLNADQLAKLDFIAPLPEQKAEFSQHIAAIDRLRLRFTASLSALDHLFASLQADAFRGNL